jgi:hypothetical protein
LPVHAFGLALVLGVVAALAGPGLFSGDEGAALAQAKVLATDGDWGIDAPLPGVDAEGVRFPIDKAERVADGRFALDPGRFAPMPRHALYPWMLSRFGAHHLAGVAVAASMVGTWVAALAAALLARRARLADARLTLWSVAIGTPLLFDGTVAAAHTLAAAAVTVGVLAGWTGVTGRVRSEAIVTRRGAPVGAGASCAARQRWSWPLVAFCTAAAVALRSEATLLVMAVVGVIGVAASTRAGVRRRLANGAPSSGRMASVGVVVGVVGAATFQVDRMITDRITGGAHGVAVPASGATGSGLLGGRIDGLFTTVFRLSYLERPTAAVALAVAAGLVLATVVMATRHAALVRPLALATSVAAVFAMVAPRPSAVPGLFVACPLLVIGAALPAPSVVRHWLRTTVLVFAGIVVLTQYAQGGGAEWGWRYLALVVPVTVPVALAGLSHCVGAVRVGAVRVGAVRVGAVRVGAVRVAASVPRPAGPTMVVAMCVVALSTAVVSVRAVHGHRARTAARVEAVADVAARTKSGDGGAPVVVSPLFSLGRFSWDHLDRQRQLRLVSGDRLDSIAARLAASGIHGFVYVVLGAANAPSVTGWGVEEIWRGSGLTLVSFRLTS